MRIVLKLGTSTLTHPTGNLNIRRVEELCKVCSDLKNAGHELVLGIVRCRRHGCSASCRWRAAEGYSRQGRRLRPSASAS